ncbi:unnamed protein product [Musa hybrid cultivar]
MFPCAESPLPPTQRSGARLCLYGFAASTLLCKSDLGTSHFFVTSEPPVPRLPPSSSSTIASCSTIRSDYSIDGPHYGRPVAFSCAHVSSLVVAQWTLLCSSNSKSCLHDKVDDNSKV